MMHAVPSRRRYHIYYHEYARPGAVAFHLPLLLINAGAPFVSYVADALFGIRTLWTQSQTYFHPTMSQNRLAPQISRSLSGELSNLVSSVSISSSNDELDKETLDDIMEEMEDQPQEHEAFSFTSGTSPSEVDTYVNCLLRYLLPLMQCDEPPQVVHRVMLQLLWAEQDIPSLVTETTSLEHQVYHPTRNQWYRLSDNAYLNSMLAQPSVARELSLDSFSLPIMLNKRIPISRTKWSQTARVILFNGDNGISLSDLLQPGAANLPFYELPMLQEMEAGFIKIEMNWPDYAHLWIFHVATEKTTRGQMLQWIGVHLYTWLLAQRTRGPHNLQDGRRDVRTVKNHQIYLDMLRLIGVTHQGVQRWIIDLSVDDLPQH